MLPARVGPVTVRLSTTAMTPDDGRPPRPLTLRLKTSPALSGRASEPPRVSSSRAGLRDTKAPSATPVVAAGAAGAAEAATAPQTPAEVRTRAAESPEMTDRRTAGPHVHDDERRPCDSAPAETTTGPTILGGLGPIRDLPWRGVSRGGGGRRGRTARGGRSSPRDRPPRPPRRATAT